MLRHVQTGRSTQGRGILLNAYRYLRLRQRAGDTSAALDEAIGLIVSLFESITPVTY